MASKRRGKESFSRWDAADYLRTEKDMVAYLQACLEEAPDDPGLLVAALGDIARARGMVQLAKETGLTAYDASYLWLARTLDADLVTLDRRLAGATDGSRPRPSA